MVVDVMALCDRLIVDNRLDENWAWKTAESIRAITNPACGLHIIGWSTGAIMACAAAGHLDVENLTLLSSTLEFCRSEQNPYGWPRKIVERMAAKLGDDRQVVLADFYDRCGMDRPQAEAAAVDIAGIGTATLQNGLRFLMQARVEPSWIKAANPVRILHGESDRIIDLRAGGLLASGAGVPLTRFPGGHAFWGEKENAAGVTAAG